MIILIAFFIALASILLGKHLFGRIFNHISLYLLAWTPIIILFQLKLIRYQDITTEVWMLILLAYLSFLLGTLTVYFGKKLNFSGNVDSSIIIWSNDNSKNIRNLILIFGIIGLLVIIQNWVVLLNKFGSVKSVLLNASLVYRMRIERTIEGQIPYFFTFSYVSLFFAAVYSAIKNKISLYTILPFTGVILKEVSQSARTGILSAFFLFITTFFIYRYFYQNKKKYISSKKVIIGFFVIFLFIFLVATLVKITRVTNERFKGATTELNELERNAFVSPSIYLYLSGHIGTLNKVILAEERSKLFAEKTLTMFYSTISKFDIVKRPKDYDKGYLIPTWINTGTYLREIYMDYGYAGLVIVPFLLGLFCTIYWYKFLSSGSLLHLSILSHLYIIVGFSFVIFVVRLSTWVFTIIILLITTWFLEKNNKKNTSGAK